MYNAFISYSHAADDKFAPSLQDALQRFAKPWYKKRNLEIFRDESSLSASPHLWNNITQALDQSEYLILLASEQSEQSKWVNREVEYWLEHKSIDNILIALTDGKMDWDDKANDFIDPDHNSLPPALDGKFDSPPFYIDLRQSKTQEDLSLANPIFKKEVLKLAAKLHGVHPNDLASEEVTVHRKMIRLRNTAIGTLAFLMVAAIAAGLIAIEKRKEAETETRRAQSNTLAAIARELLDKNATFAIRLAELAWRGAPDYPPDLPTQKIIVEAFYQPYIKGQRFFKPSLGHSGVVMSAVFSPDGKKIVTASWDSTAKIWDAQTGKMIADLTGHQDRVNIAIFSPDGQKIVTASEDGTAKIWDAQTGKIIDRSEEHTSELQSPHD
jgi:hypothetical protein